MRRKAVNGSSFLSRRRQHRRSRGRSSCAHLRRIKEVKHDWNQKSGSASKIGEKQQQQMAVKRCSVPVVESAKGGSKWRDAGVAARSSLKLNEPWRFSRRDNCIEKEFNIDYTRKIFGIEFNNKYICEDQVDYTDH
uniref:Uncharacterized protein n=1 Tax=Lactuca sativa TaxID=4236 RepID=A0A9R1XWI6_LACSA|nr:hypothetical protein LSAT_V11C100012520 [Lactuca sativa]